MLNWSFTPIHRSRPRDSLFVARVNVHQRKVLRAFIRNDKFVPMVEHRDGAWMRADANFLFDHARLQIHHLHGVVHVWGRHRGGARPAR